MTTPIAPAAAATTVSGLRRVQLPDAITASASPSTMPESAEKSW